MPRKVLGGGGHLAVPRLGTRTNRSQVAAVTGNVSESMYKIAARCSPTDITEDERERTEISHTDYCRYATNIIIIQLLISSLIYLHLFFQTHFKEQYLVNF